MWQNINNWGMWMKDIGVFLYYYCSVSLKFKIIFEKSFVF